MVPMVRSALAHQLHAGALLRALTMFLCGIVVVLGALAAHHADLADSGDLPPGVAQLQDEHHISDSAGSSVGADGSALLGIAGGCAVLVICCVVALTLLNRRSWSAALARYLGSALPTRSGPARAVPVVLDLPTPSLITLSISRT
ncbi:hypothetical protein BH10ACT7_BH10ACT7_20750 [soil metagenome]